MNKKLMAVAVAAAMAPGLALAQSSVTISGVFKTSLDNYRIASPAAARAGLNTSEWRVTDNSSRIIFNVTEDLGGGMQAIAQLDVRFSTDTGTQNTAGAGAAAAAITTLNNGGNTWVGLRGKSWGTVTMGQHDLHYGKQPDDIASKAGVLMASSVSLMDATSNATNGSQAIAGNTRTRNVLRYDTPQWGIFNGTVAWSANPTGVESDLVATNTARRGNAWTLNPQLTGANWQVGYSYWRQKADSLAGGAAAGANVGQRGDVLYGFYRWGGFKLGLAWNKSRTMSELATGTVDSSRRTAWSIPLSYTWGNHNIFGHYTKAGNDKTTAADDSAKMWAVAYVYDLSKRTSAGITYAKITNAVGANYNFFTNSNTGAFGSVNGAPVAGEDPRLIAFSIRHAF